MNLNTLRIAIAKTNHIGDVAISLPVASLIKKHAPKAHVFFIARGKACEVAKRQQSIDSVIDWSEIESAATPSKALAKFAIDIFIQLNPCKIIAKTVYQAGINIRIGSCFRLYNWRYCNRLAYIPRKSLNKRLLDLMYLKPLGIKVPTTLAQINALYKLTPRPLTKAQQQLLATDKFNLVIHPSALTTEEDRWPIDKFAKLISQLDKSQFQIFISGLKSERIHYQQLLELDNVVDIMGLFSLGTFFDFLSKADGLIAGSTGPLHLAAAHNIRVLGLYKNEISYIKRWHPLGSHSQLISAKQVKDITVSQVQKIISQWPEQK